MTFKLSDTLWDTTRSNFCLKHCGNVMDRSMHAAFLLLCSVPSSDHKVWLTKRSNSQLRQTNSPSISVSASNKYKKLLQLLFAIQFPPCTHPEVPEIVELDILEGASLSLLFKGTYLKTNILRNHFHRNFHFIIYCVKEPY